MEILTTNSVNVPTMSRWQDELKSSFRDLESLFDFLNLNRDDIPGLKIPDGHFPIRVPLPFARRIQKGNPSDPLLRQVISTTSSGLPSGVWENDPVQDKSFESTPGLIQKYSGRVLLITTGACAIHCRYCFRQNFDYSTAIQNEFTDCLDQIGNDSSINEVILSGGDPLLKTDESLKQLIEQIENIPHIKRLRIHTRTPIVLPSRITREFLDTLQSSRLSVFIVFHINHANEIDSDVLNVFDQVQGAGAVMLNQAVLLRGVNDNFESQKQLCEKLINNRVIPYYLHLLDQIKGAENFVVSEDHGVEIIEELKKALPGYGIPSLVREIAGQPSKTSVR